MYVETSQAFQSNGGYAPYVTWHCEALTMENCCALHQEWEDLAVNASEPNIFQSPSFIAKSLPLFAPYKPKIVCIRDQGTLIGVVILRRDLGYAKLPVSFWRTALHQEQFLGTPLVRQGYEEAFLSGLVSWLDNTKFSDAFLQLSMISADGKIAQALINLSKSNKRAIFATNRYERASIRPILHKDANPEAMLRSSRRKGMQKAMKHLSMEGHVTVERLANAEFLDEWTQEFLALEDTGWKHQNRSSILSNCDETELYKALIKDAFEKGNLNFTRMCVDGQAIAYTLDIAAPPTVYCLKSAIDQRYRKFSPGVLMEYEVLKHHLEQPNCVLVDGCSSPNNTMLNEMWPDRRAISDFVIARQGLGYGLLFKLIFGIKTLTKTAVSV